MASTTAAARCPACNTPLVRGRANCVSCGMSRQKMAEFVKAQQAAAARGVVTLVDKAEDGGPALGQRMRRWAVPAAALVVLALLAGVGYVAFGRMRAKPAAPWLAYPADPALTAQEYFTLAGKDTEDAGEQAYKLLGMRQKHPDEDGEVARYRQTYHDMDKYFNDTFGTGWQTSVTYDPPVFKTPEHPQVTVHVGSDVLHVNLAAQGPEGGPVPTPMHFGVVSITEFPIDAAGAAQKMGAVTGILKGYGATGSIRDLQAIVAVGGGHPHETPFETKLRLMPLLQDPHSPGLHRAIVQSYAVRKDATVHAELESITTDARYDPDAQRTAKQVLDGTVDPAELIGNGVEGDY